MEKRRLGRTGHFSSVAIFGTAAFYQIEEANAELTLEFVKSTDINHIDVAPGYGDAEDRLGPWLNSERKNYFLGGKTQLRTKELAAKELRESLRKLKTDQFDLFQLHAVATIEELDEVTGKDGALQAICDARDEGLTQFVGITSHGWDTPAILLEALQRFDFDTVMIPINPNFYSHPTYREKTVEVLELCAERDVGTMVIKSIAKGAWGKKEKIYTSWYEPFDTLEEIQQGIDFALSQKITGICTVADVKLLPLVVQACDQFMPMNMDQQEKRIAVAKSQEPIF